jgi:hypothetical protein
MHCFIFGETVCVESQSQNPPQAVFTIPFRTALLQPVTALALAAYSAKNSPERTPAAVEPIICKWSDSPLFSTGGNAGGTAIYSPFSIFVVSSY